MPINFAKESCHSMEQVKFPKKTIHIPKDSREIDTDVNALLDKNEAAIRAYIARYIYTSSISTDTNLQLDTIFKQVRSTLYEV